MLMSADHPAADVQLLGAERRDLLGGRRRFLRDRADVRHRRGHLDCDRSSPRIASDASASVSAKCRISSFTARKMPIASFPASDCD
ncbi:hypothetical protein [Paenibacillus sp.]|uniref:hypothetical protein n=1 Tax=Paenibacillus sp. TaxID=58172 RepID=UPI002810DD18|nr:hypothetical protein [Paenibacillus sp.]